MNRFLAYLHHLRQKPEPVRRRIAFGTSAGVTGVVALGWVVALVAGGSLSLDTSTIAESGLEAQGTLANTKSNFSQLLGAAGIAGGVTPPALTTVDSYASSTADQAPKEEPTFIRF